MVVIDMSWAKISDEMKESVYKQVNKLFSVLERRVRKNLARVFIVHPSAYTRAVTLFLRQFTSSKLKSKITEVYNWESLQSDINKEDIALPDTSKDYITKTFSTIKVNSKGKNQKRLIKFTTDSLLNIDPRTKRVQNEKKLSQFEKIEVPVDSNELLIYFNNQNPSSGRGRFVKGSSSDKLQRKYIFESAKDRDDVILDIYRTSFFAPSFEFPQEYRVVKVNKRGRHQDRILKLTCDSLLNLDSTTIKSEISFAGIDSVQEDEKPNVIWLQFKAETKRRKIICKDSTNLLGALREGLDRYRAGGELPEQPNYSDNEIFGEE